MCLNLNSKYHPHGSKIRSFTAKKDIFTLKFIKNIDIHNNTGSAWIQDGFKYKFNTVIKSRFSFGGTRDIHKGLHSLHTGCGNLQLDTFYGNKGVVLAKIPKGSRFYIGYNDDIVSNRLVLVRTILFGHKQEYDCINSMLWRDAVDICKNELRTDIGLGNGVDDKFEITPPLIKRLFKKLSETIKIKKNKYDYK